MKYLITTLFFLFFINSQSFGLTIIEPKDGATFHPGDKVKVKVRLDEGEKLNGVLFYTLKLSQSKIDFIPPYSFKFKINPEFTGIETIRADGKLKDDSHVQSEIKINVTLPGNIFIEEINVDPKRIYLRKVPEGTRSVDAYEKRQIDVYGIYSDGIKRDITSSSKGTIYQSDNVEVAKVDTNGIIEAVGIGKAIITIRNGAHFKTVGVKVREMK